MIREILYDVLEWAAYSALIITLTAVLWVALSAVVYTASAIGRWFVKLMKKVIYCGFLPPPRPRRVSLGRKEHLSMSRFGITFALPAVGAPDVAQRELTVTVNGGDPPLSRTYSGQPAESDEWEFDADDEVSVTLVDIDGHGNRSQPSAALSFTVVDDVAPPQPGELGVANKRQIEE